MMINLVALLIIGHKRYNEVQTMTQVFLPNMHFKTVTAVSNEGITVLSKFSDNTALAKVFDSATLISEYSIDIDVNDSKSLQISIKLSVFFAFSHIFDKTVPWGILTGIRPTKIVHELWALGLSTSEVKSILNTQYKVINDKVELAVNVALAEEKILNSISYDDISIYIGIPFCPSRCLYCSFTSYPIDLYQHTIHDYLDALYKELLFCKKYFDKHNISSIYIGGGTPTSLNNEQLTKLFYIINDVIDVSKCKEFTVEAGRPDTLSVDKLSIMKKNNVSRLSINPQSMNDKTLEKIGRNHLASDVISAFNNARDFGFLNINMDIILGLMDETLSDISYTLCQIQSLLPESLTVHTLSIKRASKLKEDLQSFKFIEFNEIEKMLNITKMYANNMNMLPYYMYRQKNMIGNFENVGYCATNCECIYNIQIMEEKHSMLAFGAGATSKIIEHNSNKLFRIFNVKNVLEYINRIDEMINRKKGLEAYL